SNSDLLGTSLRCEISTVNRSDFSVDIAEAFCIAILTELDDAASIGDDPTPAEAEPPSATDLQASREAFIQRWAQAGFPAQSEAPEYYCDSWPETTAMHYDWLKADSRHNGWTWSIGSYTGNGVPDAYGEVVIEFTGTGDGEWTA